MKHLFKLTIISLVLVGCAKPPLPPQDGTIIEQIDSLHDDYRSRHNLPPLTRLAQLDLIAQEHSVKMDKTIMSHAGFSQRCQEASKIVNTFNCGENVAKGQTTPSEVMSAWMSSPGHRRNILGSYKYIGVGVQGTSYTVIFK